MKYLKLHPIHENFNNGVNYIDLAKKINSKIDSMNDEGPNLSPIEYEYEYGNDYRQDKTTTIVGVKYYLQSNNVTDDESFSNLDEETQKRVKELFGCNSISDYFANK